MTFSANSCSARSLLSFIKKQRKCNLYVNGKTSQNPDAKDLENGFRSFAKKYKDLNMIGTTADIPLISYSTSVVHSFLYPKFLLLHFGLLSIILLMVQFSPILLIYSVHLNLAILMSVTTSSDPIHITSSSLPYPPVSSMGP